MFRHLKLRFLFCVVNLIKDVNNIELKDLQNERCSRISANDLIYLLRNSADNVAVVDLRNNLEFKRAHLKHSINIPFASISLSDIRLEALNVPDLESRLTGRTVVVVSPIQENMISVSTVLYIVLISNFLRVLKKTVYCLLL